VFNIKSLAIAAAVSAGVVFAMPVSSQAMQTKSTMHVQPGSQSNLQQKKSTAWWTRHCRVSNDVKCGHHSALSSHRQNYSGHSIYRRHHKSGVTINAY
jgi:hypothetical protein